MDKASERASFMLRIAAIYIRKYCPDELYHYDEANCDGGCVADDCDAAAEELRYKHPDHIGEVNKMVQSTQNTVSEQHSGCPICGKPREWVMSQFGSRIPVQCCIQEQRAKTQEDK